MKHVISLIFVIAIISSCNSSSKPGEKYPEQVRTNFINSCSGKLPPEYKKACECMLDQVEKKYSLKDYIQLEQDIKAGKDVPGFMSFTDSARQICFTKK